MSKETGIPNDMVLRDIDQCINPLEPEEETLEYPFKIDFNEFVTGLFPEIGGTKIPDLLYGIAEILVPLSTKKDHHPLVRGSTISRTEFGDPPGYWDISRLFRQLLPQAQLSDRLTKKVVEKLALGPRDFDIEYPPAITVLDLHSAIEQKLNQQGFTRTSEPFVYRLNDGRHDYKVKIEKRDIGIDSETRTITKISFYLDQKEKHDLPVLKMDLVAIADYGQSEDEVGLDPLVAPNDHWAHANLIQENGRVMIELNGTLKEIFDESYALRVPFSINSITRKALGILRVIKNRLFWGCEFYKVDSQMVEAQWPHRNFWKSAVRDFNVETERKKLEQRQAEIVTLMLVGLTYDPAIFLHLMVRSGLINITALGGIIDNPVRLNAVLDSVVRKGIHHASVIESPDAYRTMYLINNNKVEKTGPFFLLDRLIELKKRGVIKDPDNLISLEKQTPIEKLQTIIRLINPAQLICGPDFNIKILAERFNFRD